MENRKQVKIVSIISFFVIAIVGTLLHFVFEWTSSNLLVGAISAVNESVWEHLKILVIPMFICSIYEYIVLKDKRDNFFVALVSRIITGMLVILVVYYTYTSIIGKNIAVVDITTFFVAALISQIVWYVIMTKEPLSRNLDIISMIISFVILMLFIVFTYVPPKVELFRDSTNDTYGIFKEK